MLQTCNENLEKAGIIKVLYVDDTIGITKPGLFSKKGYVGGFLLEVGGVRSEYACLVLILISGLDNLTHLMSNPIKRTQIRMRTNFVICNPTTSHSHFQQ